MIYKNINGVLFVPKDSTNLVGFSIIIADNIQGRYYGYLILSNYDFSKNGFNQPIVEANHDDYRDIIDLVFSVRISDERKDKI